MDTQTNQKALLRTGGRILLALLAFLIGQWAPTELYAVFLTQFGLDEGLLPPLFLVGSLCITVFVAYPLFSLTLQTRPLKALRLLWWESGRENSKVDSGYRMQMTLQALVAISPAVLVLVFYTGAGITSALVKGVGFWTFLLQNVVILPILEETMFRGIVLERLRPHGRRAALVISTLAFAGGHLNPLNCLIALPLGYLLGQVAWETGNRRLTASLHAGINLLCGLLIPLALTAGIPAEVFIAVFTLLLLWGLWQWMHRANK